MQKKYAVEDLHELYGGEKDRLKVEQGSAQCSSDTLMGRLNGQDTLETSCSESSGDHDPSPEESTLDSKKNFLETSEDLVHSGAVWDIFRRQDVPKLIQYLEKHKKEFRHTSNRPVNTVSIHTDTL